MSFFPPDMPRPEPNMDDEGFWTRCADQTLCFQACGRCATLRHPPTPICSACHSTDVQWVEAPSEAEVYTFTIVRHANDPAVRSAIPYVGAVVVFPALPGVRLITNVTDIDPGEVKIGMPVSLWWDEIGEGMFIPRFKPERREESSEIINGGI